MPGPSASILVREPVSAQLELAARGVIVACADMVDGDQFWVRGVPFTVRFSPDYPGEIADIQDLDRLPAVLGWTPWGAVSVDAGVGGDLAHRLLGRLTVQLCAALNGVIDLGGAIPVGPDLSGAMGSQPRRLAALGGVLYATSYRIDELRFGTCHYVDIAFMEGWLRDPRFRLVK